MLPENVGGVSVCPINSGLPFIVTVTLSPIADAFTPSPTKSK